MLYLLGDEILCVHLNIAICLVIGLNKVLLKDDYN